ncbi:hypothetical protein LUZ61_005600 [Rhynchospora tenuis]|uniref:non-specific serine/threonine protein kinase n=1 Tax=Rhynchospora tenuis TaxID=198213 RepID=A0AAD5ZQ42_9POAL|nr:hypothetical protein LUZ61_005600 [Rhynchospora tenuis]
MGLGQEELQIGAWDGANKAKESTGKKNKSVKRVEEREEQPGCWIRFPLMGSCMSSRSKVDTSISSASTRCESKSTNEASSHEARDSAAKAGTGLMVVSGSTTTTTSNTDSISSSCKVGEELKVASQLRKFTFQELKSATRNFRPESLLGEGGFGCVFKGWIEENGTAPVKPGTGLTVAVKTLNHDGLQGHKEWVAEVNFLGNLQHPNLVKLIGYCIEDDQRLLVYEFMPRGSLENHLFRRSMPLPWATRMKIALGAAKGLAFLHEEAERPVIYRDFKTSNILLDTEYNAKLSDFGLAKDGPEGDKTHVSTRVMGTYGYAAPEYVMTGHLTSKSDVYSFGVVLLEMMTGRRSMDKNRPNGEHNLVEWARPHLGERRRFYRLIDPRLEGNFSIKGAQKAAQLAHACLSRDPKARPLMSQVVEALKPLLNLKDMASSSYFFQSMQAERAASFNGLKSQNSLGRNGHHLPMRSLSNGPHASPYRHSPKPNVKSAP